MLEDGKKIMPDRYENAKIFCKLVGAKYKEKTAVQRHLDTFLMDCKLKSVKSANR